ncbi:MAG: LysR family transcriptional regulator, partial [Duncaniella sp.]|nr:LysR family transcriptional regulator [Duncaniella sp.]
MELRQLRYFVKTAETLNFSEASRALNIAQSTLSQQIRQLEDELDVKLFERNSHAMYLTEAGSELLPLALQTVRDATACTDRMHDLQKMLAGTLNIGVTYSFSPIL